MMTAALTVQVGHDGAWQFTVTKDGALLDLTPYDVSVTVKANAMSADANAMHVYAEGSGITVTDAANGVCELATPHSDNTASGVFWWRLDLTTPGGFVYEVFQGPYTVQPA